MRSFAICAAAFTSRLFACAQSVDSYVASESPIAKTNLLANIGPNGLKAPGAKPGVVVASPSQVNPPYFFTWTRDSALVYKVLIDQFTQGQDTSLRGTIDDYVSAQKVIQQISNPSGTVSSGGLGEPKFYVNETAFTGAWGRPQRDGPALRSTALITYANWLIANSNQTFVTSILWPIIKLDLDYVSSNWNQSTFDLWEEINSSSFFTSAVQHRALREGAALASKIGQSDAVSGYTTQAANILCFLQSYWNPSGAYMTANTGGGRSGKDSNTVLTSIHIFDPNAGCDANTFQPCSDKALANLLAYENAFRSVYSLNSGIPANQAVAVGRYPEDSYMGGNPWYLSTFAVAEQLYDALYVWNKEGSMDVTSISQPFFALFSSGVAPGTYTSLSTTFKTLTSAIKTYADGFIAIAAKYTPSGGGLAEQYSKSNGSPLSAVDLTWSYASALTAFNARADGVPASWGAKGLTVPSTCSSNSGGGGGGSSGLPITFNEQATTSLGENIFLTGSIPQLANWSPDNALALSAANYPRWSATVNIPASTCFEYKFIRKFNGAVTWESDPNRQLCAPASGSFTENDTWR